MLSKLFPSIRKPATWLVLMAQVALVRVAFGVPLPAAANGTLAPGNTISISGKGFGTTGPNVVMAEDFERDTPGQKVQLGGAPTGAWTGYNSGNAFLASPYAHTGRVGFHAYDQSNQSANILALQLSGQYQEAFISYWVAIPPGATFPGMSGPTGVGFPGPQQFSGDSSWKFAWLLQDLQAYGKPQEFDLMALAYGGKGLFVPATSNSGYTMFIEPGTYALNSNSIGVSWWSWTAWNRITTWLRGNSTVPTGAPGGIVQTLNSEHGMSTWLIGNPTTYPTSAMFQDGVPQYFTAITVPGWVREGSGPSADPTYDDIYIAVGPGAAARAEITDSPLYANSHHATILAISNWSDTQITAKVPSAGLDFNGPAYLYITDANGLTSEVGLPIGTAALSVAIDSPSPPGDVNVH